MKKAKENNNKLIFGKRKVGKAKKRKSSKDKNVKKYRGQGR
jgi:hypothetical protein